ncbi:MAG: type II toxin-antitoxin system VapC family toxin [Candidatus Binataceae bacterium]
MRFWDSSALVPVFLVEPTSDWVRKVMNSDPGVAVWALTRVELMSAIERRRRDDPDLASRFSAARADVMKAWSIWTEIAMIEAVREHAERVVATHPLRAADALQLGAALVAAGGSPATLQFITLDRRLAVAAEREGFPVLGPH